MPDLDDANAVLAHSERFENAVDAIAWQAEERIDTPCNQPVDEQVRHCLSHSCLSMLPIERRERALRLPACPLDHLPQFSSILGGIAGLIVIKVHIDRLQRLLPAENAFRPG